MNGLSGMVALIALNCIVMLALPLGLAALEKAIPELSGSSEPAEPAAATVTPLPAGAPAAQDLRVVQDEASLAS
ncbi:hypothetical protein [Luteipulveratus flavus]|uniref:Uncharacterized protein n=1 Tax=Luteipulveratus flavus TaxID=3031728 RepID=A0ABT6C4A5_9MICO|nr:hypothetical protein [Luteipulveratus sp. YIM 133296]MDF8263648.1 hypothetical protein [Luteipulveratus sp. YIM 133296]